VNPALYLQNDGNLVLYSAENNSLAPLWASGTNANRTTLSTCDAQSPSVILDGSSLGVGGCIRSPGGAYELIMQSDNNLVLYYEGTTNQGTALWDSNTTITGSSWCYLTMQTSGNLTMTNSNGLIWQSGVTAALGSVLVLQNDGNLVTYALSAAGYGYSTWATGTNGNLGDALTPGQLLTPGQYLQSPGGQYQLQMGSAGVLVLVEMMPYSSTATPTASYQCPIWTGPTSSYTTSSSFVTAPVPSSYSILQTDGNFVLYPPTAAGTAAVWASGSYGKSVGTITLQSDGNLVAYSPSGADVWSTGTNVNRGSVWCTGEILQGSDGSGPGIVNGDAGNGPFPSGDNFGQTITSLSGGASYLVPADDADRLQPGSLRWVQDMVLGHRRGVVQWLGSHPVRQLLRHPLEQRRGADRGTERRR
jgi:hypothetical protein